MPYSVYLVYEGNDYNNFKALFRHTPAGLAEAQNYASPNGWIVVEGTIEVPFFAKPSIPVSPIE